MTIKTIYDFSAFIDNIRHRYQIEFPRNAGVFIKLDRKDYYKFLEDFHELIDPLSSKQSISELSEGITVLTINGIETIIGIK